MRKLLTLVTLFVSVLCSHTLSAQVALGVRAGGNFANLTYGNDIAANQIRHARNSLGGGVFADFTISDAFSLRTGLDYCGMGGNMETEYNIADQMTLSTRSVTTLNYLSLPVQAFLGWEIAESKVRFNVGAGVFFGYLLKGNYAIRGPKYFLETGQIIILRNTTSWRPTASPQESGILIDDLYAEITTVKKDITDDARRMNFGLTGSLALSYPVGERGMLWLEYGMNYGFVKIAKEGSDKTKTYASRAMLGYSFRLGK